jgi:hypothetical protein
MSFERSNNVEAFLFTVGGSSTEVPENGKALRLDRSLRAQQRHTGVPWELVRTEDVLGTKHRKRVTPVKQHPSAGTEISPAGE